MLRLRVAFALVLGPVAFAPAAPPPLPVAPPPRAKEPPLRAEWPKKRLEYWKQIRQLADSGKYDQVLGVAAKVLELERELLGDEHELVADSLHRLATIQLDARDYVRAEKTAREAAGLFAKRYGPKDWRAADLRATAELGARVAKLTPDERKRLAAADKLYDEAHALHTRREHRAALPKYAAALDEYRRLLGEDSRPVVDSLVGLGHVSTELREFAQAEEYLAKADTACVATFGPIHPNSGTIQNHYGVLAIYRADYAQAETRFKKAFDVHLATSGPHSDAAALALANLAGLSAELGDYVSALRAFTQVYEALRANHGVLNYDVATVLHKIGHCRMELGDCNTAEQAFLLALEIRRRLGGDESPAGVYSLNSLGLLYLRIGDRVGADRTLNRTAELARVVFGAGTIEYAATMNNLGSLYAEVGRYAEAEAAYRAALRIKVAILGDRHADAVLALHNLGSVLRLAGKVVEAEPLLLKSSALAKEVWGERHPDYPTTRYVLGALLLLKGEYRRAEELANEAVTGHERVRGPVHPLVADALELRAKAEAASGRPRVALATLDRAMKIQDEHLRMVFGFATESAMQTALWRATNTTKVMLSVAQMKLPDDPAAAELSLTWVLRRKAGVLDAVCRHRELLLLTSDRAEVRKEAAAVRQAFARYQRLAATPPTAGTDEAKHAAAVTASRRGYEEAEGRLRRVVELFKPSTAAAASTAAVRRKLPAGSALVEFVRVEPHDWTATGEARVWLAPRYFALVLSPDPAAAVRLIDLGDAAEIDRCVRELRAAITRAPRDLKNGTEQQLEAEYRRQAAALSKRVFAPLREAIGGAKFVLLAPDADLNLLPFEALVDADGRYLIETYRFNYLSSGRDLLRVRAKPGAGTVVFAGPDFDWRPLAPEPRLDPTPSGPGGDTATIAGVDRGLLTRGRSGLRWKPLPGAAGEADDLKEALAGTAFGPVAAFTGADARKSAFRGLKHPPRVLHVATHGFFLPPPAADDEGPAPTGLVGVPPLLRSGLVLAGANVRPGAASDPQDDGWLTAEEVGRMDLRGTELVVLSACETGLGEVHAGEGVFGLRRAFLFAGTDTLLVSLFKVPDPETRELMRAFYAGLKDGRGAAAVLHDSKRAAIDRRRVTAGAAHPFYWASFIALGSAE